MLPAQVQGRGNHSMPIGGSGSYHEDSAKSCNCSATDDDPGQTITTSICQRSSVEVSVGAEIIEVTAGLSRTTCLEDIELEPGECAYATYNFSCTYSWWSWE